jgi:hypothetical protein
MEFGAACEEGPEGREEEADGFECSHDEAEEGEVVEDWVLLDESANQFGHHIKYQYYELLGKYKDSRNIDE